MTTKTKTPSTKKATAKKVVKTPAAKAPRKVSQMDRIEQRLKQMEERLHHSITAREPLFENIQRDLSLIRSGMDFQKELDRVAPEAPKPAGLQDGDYCQADEHHSLKEVAERLTAMGFRYKPCGPQQDEYSITLIGHRLEHLPLGLFRGTHIPTPEFLSRAEVTAREQGLVPVVPEPWRPKVNGLAKYRGVVSKVTDHSTSVGEWWFISGRWVPTRMLSEPSPAEVQAHQAEIAAKEEAARVPKFGSRVEYKYDKGWRIATESADCVGMWLITRSYVGTTGYTWAKRHEFKVIP